MLTAAQLLELKPPARFRWAQRPTLRVPGLLVAEDPITAKNHPARIQRLYKWAVENSIGLEAGAGGWIQQAYDEWYVTLEWKVTANKVSLTKELYGDGTIDCHGCERQHPIGTLRCSGCGGSYFACQQCSRSGQKIHLVARSAAGRGNVRLCSACGPICKSAGCSNRVYSAEHNRRVRPEHAGLCSECCPIVSCFACGNTHPREKCEKVMYRGVEQWCCPECYKNKVCPVCNLYKNGQTTVAGKRMCKGCATIEIDKKRVQYEKFDAEEIPKGGSLHIPSLPERPFRLISVETEVDGDKDVLAGTLYRCGIVRVPEVEAYSSHARNDTQWAAHLKHDGSVTGGELISHCMDLSDKEQAGVFYDTLIKLKSLQKLEKVAYNSNCGGHIHIDAHNFGFGDVWRLLTIWNYLEDVIYRLAGAGHKYGHRTLDKGHDVANGGRGYANLPVKGPFGTKGVAGQNIRAQERMCGLNFVPYMGAIANCMCGAFGAGDKDGRNCSCNLGKATIEWRVWNSTGNPRILHAWIAFMQAMHAYADQGVDPTAEWEKEFPAFAYTRTPFDKCSKDHQATALDRLKWIFANLVLTDEEKDSLIYTIKQSQLVALGEDNIEALRKVPPAEAHPIKAAPRNPAARKVPIVVKPPKDGATKVASVRSASRAMQEVMFRDLVNAGRR